MYKRHIATFALAVLLGVWSGPARAFDLGVAPSTRKILPATPMPQAVEAELEAARNEWEAFQIVIRDEAGASSVDVSLSELCAAGGACIPASAARLYREYFVEVTHPSSLWVTLHERAAGLYPDPLIPFHDPYSDDERPVGAPFDLAAGETEVIFVDWHVPLDAAAGDYTGSARVTAEGRQAVELPIHLTVWSFAIPRERSIGTAFGFSANLVRRFHGGPEGAPAGDVPAITDRYYMALHENRIDPTTIDGPVDFEFDGDQLLPVDWSGYDAAVGPWLDGSRFPDGVGMTRFNVGRFRPGSGLGSLTEAQYKVAAAAFAEHLQEQGWWQRAYVYATDEPWGRSDPDGTYAQIAEDAERLEAASPLWKGHVLVTGPFDERVAGRIGIWCPVTPMYDDWFYSWEPKAGWDTYTERLALGEELWFYVCNHNTPPYAGYDLDSAIGYEPRIVKWGAWFERATGFLYWRTNYWVEDDPWHVLLNLDEFGDLSARNGDGFLLYPGDHDGTAGGKGSPPEIAIDGPIESFRLKQIRDGLEDWEMFRLASDLGAEDFVRQQVRRAYSRFGDLFYEDCQASDESYYCPDDQPWTLDENVLLDARRQVAQKIEELTAPDQAAGCSGCHSACTGTGLILLAALAFLGLRRAARIF
ncbi:MAG TPA: DUF4091 domain-containing protein [Myxococcota bacterium]|nr:DUF4091 domain-containing protein [Myxococcota bacterium]